VSADAVSNISFPKPGTVLCQTENVGRFRTEVVIQARDIGARLTEIRPTDDDLESVFRYLVERR
jgi:ABC-2 type transport system ATP-binding protein